MVLGILGPDQGAISVLGAEPGFRNAAGIGFLPEERGLYRRMTALEAVIFFGCLKGMSQREASGSAIRILDRLGISSRSQTRVEQLSKGLAQKVQIATALVNTPRLLILDEPFSGLDPVNQELLEIEILNAAKAGAAVMFSTHIMQHAERLCDRLLLLRDGRKVFEGTVDQARHTQPATVKVIAKAAMDCAPYVLNCRQVQVLGDGWTDFELTLQPHANPDDVLLHCFQTGLEVRRFEVAKPNLHDVFINITSASGAK